MQPVLDYIESQAPREQEILHYLCAVITSFKGLTARFRYGIPFFYGRKWICYLNVVKKGGGVELVFLQAQHFEDPCGLLEARGRKMVKGVILRSVEAAPGQSLLDTIRAAVAYDRTL